MTLRESAYAGRRLGRRDPDPARSQRQLRIGDYLKFRAPDVSVTPPESVDHHSRVTNWGLGRNDLFATCGPTAAANMRRVITRYVTGTENDVSDDAIFALYALQNPGFDQAVSAPGGPQDQGVDLQRMCDDLLTAGIGGMKALAHASVNVHDPAELRECVTLFGCLILGVDLQQSQQTQTPAKVWTYDPSPDWGGHAVMSGKFGSSPDHTDVITWAEEVALTDAFDQQQLVEAHVLIWPENLKISAFQRGVDLEQLAADYKQLTGRDFPMPADPTVITPPPAPVPPPDPVPVPVPGADPMAQFEQMIQGQLTQLTADLEAQATAKIAAALAPVRDLVSQLDAALKAAGA